MRNFAGKIVRLLNLVHNPAYAHLEESDCNNILLMEGRAAENETDVIQENPALLNFLAGFRLGFQKTYTLSVGENIGKIYSV
ncbi:MAG: hypothetical protein ACLTQG_30645 [Hungatella sp.]|uniref:hypothetical protein n=1 Tax=Hungatella sp. TaxID=2613924 RepID=UPI0039969D1B